MSPAVMKWVRRPWVWLAVALCIALSSAATLRFAPVFQVDQVEVLGNGQVSADDVIAAAKVSDSTPMVALPIDEIESRVESLDAVAAARVVRDWPDRIEIVIRERRAVGYVESANGIGLVGSDGSIYREQDEAPKGLPQLPAIAEGSAQVGDSYSDAAGEAENAAFAVAASIPNSFRRALVTISATGTRTVRLTFADGVVVKWGSSGSPEEKATVVNALRERQGWGSTFTVVDVTAPEAPALS